MTYCFPCNINKPANCGIDPCFSFKTGTDLVHYNGAALPNSGVNTCDTLTVSLQKLDNALTPSILTPLILSAIQNNPTFKATLLTIINS